MESLYFPISFCPANMYNESPMTLRVWPISFSAPILYINSYFHFNLYGLNFMFFAICYFALKLKIFYCLVYGKNFIMVKK